MNFKRAKAFTLAETLITLAIIGVVASLTITVLYNNYQKHQYVAGLKKAYSEFSQMFKQYIADEGVQDLSQTDIFAKYSGEMFFTSLNRQGILENVIKKYFKIDKSCKYNNTDCAISESYLNKSGSYTTFSTNRYSFSTIDGMYFSIVLPQQGTCKPNYSAPSNMKSFCGNVIVDVNGPKPPNKKGRDYFEDLEIGPDGSLFPSYGQAYAQYFNNYPGGDWTTSTDYWMNSPTACGKLDDPIIPSNTDGFCIPRIMDEGWEMNY